jgi:hypothetical protein
MVKRTNQEKALGKALDLWQAPAESGEPRVCLATTFTFDATFFETECLGRFLQLDSHPSEGDSIEYLIEREEKLAAARVSVLVDQHHASEKESMRWDVLSIRPPRGVQHAKMAVLCWANCVRVLIGSGNLTEPGYRKNVEVFGVIEIQSLRKGPVDEVLTCLGFLDSILNLSVGSDDRSGPRRRTREAIYSVRNQIAQWPKGSNRERYPTPIFSGLGQSVFQQMRNLWPGSSAPWWASVVSPFFDSAPNDRIAARALLDILSKRHERQINLSVPFEDLPDGSKRLFVSKGTVDELGSAPRTEISVYQVLNEQQGEIRALHAKEIYLENDDWRLLLMGSSNFTRAGLGIVAGNSNIEANLAYRVNSEEKGASIIAEVFPEELDEPVDLNSTQIIWNPAFNEDDEGISALTLPSGFEEVLYRAGEHATLCLHIRNPLPERWIVKIPGGENLVSNESWTNTADYMELDWAGRPVPFILEVCWKSKAGEKVASWPVNVENPSLLLPPEALRDLALEEFLEILGSTRPLHKSVAAVIRKRNRKKSKDIELNPLKRVNTEEFLLRRTQRVALALERMREKMERPVLTSDALEWRISGPLGPKALAEVLIREAKQPAEAAFFLAELSLTVGRVTAEKPAAGGLPKAVIEAALNDCVHFLHGKLDGIDASAVPSDIWRYVKDAFREASK